MLIQPTEKYVKIVGYLLRLVLIAAVVETEKSSYFGRMASPSGNKQKNKKQLYNLTWLSKIYWLFIKPHSHLIYSI